MIETLGAGAPRSESPPTGICVVLDARTGRVLTTWRGTAARPPERASARSARARAPRAQNARLLIEQTIALNDADVTPAPALQFGHQVGRGYTSWAAHGSAFTLANWDAGPARIRLPNVFKPELDAAIRNVKDVVVHMCFTRAFCSSSGVRDDLWDFFKVTGNSNELKDGRFAVGSFYLPILRRVFLDPLGGYQNDTIAHELGHHIDHIAAADDLQGNQEQKEVAEGIADMFAYDFDREDATIGEDSFSGKNTGTPLRNWATSILRQPFRMSQYQCGAEFHFNSTILSHAYYSFVQQVGPDVAGFLLYQVPAQLGPGARFTSVANAFVDLATIKYQNAPQVAAAARQAFLVDGGLTQGPPPCLPAAPPPPPPLPPPLPANVAVPDVRGDSPGAASFKLAAVELRIGTQRSVVDDTCNDIGAVLSQTPSAGTVVARGTAVNLSIGQRPTHPCP